LDMSERKAAQKIQARQRGNSARTEFKDVRDEEARRQWVAYYLQLGNYAEARELGWEGLTCAASVDRRVKAANLMQAHARGSMARVEYRDKRDEEARRQWVAYYLALDDFEQARGLGWDEQEQGLASKGLAQREHETHLDVVGSDAASTLCLEPRDSLATQLGDESKTFSSLANREAVLEHPQDAPIFSARSDRRCKGSAMGHYPVRKRPDGKPKGRILKVENCLSGSRQVVRADLGDAAKVAGERPRQQRIHRARRGGGNHCAVLGQGGSGQGCIKQRGAQVACDPPLLTTPPLPHHSCYRRPVPYIRKVPAARAVPAHRGQVRDEDPDRLPQPAVLHHVHR